LNLENSQLRARISSLDAAKGKLEADLAATLTEGRAGISLVDSLAEEARRVRVELASRQTIAAQEAAARQVTRLICVPI